MPARSPVVTPLAAAPANPADNASGPLGDQPDNLNQENQP